MVRTWFISVLLLLAVPLIGQKWERFTRSFNKHYSEFAYSEALDVALKALDMAEQRMDSSDVRFMLARYNVALAYYGLEDLVQAREHIAAAFGLMVPYFTYDPNHAEVCELYGRIETGLGYHKLAETYLSRARDIKEYLYGKESHAYVRSLYYQSELEMARAQWDRMAEVLEEALGTQEQHLLVDQEYARYANYLGLIYMNNGYNDHAADNFKRAISAYDLTGIKKDFPFGHASNNLALLLYYDGDFEGAAWHFTRADSIYQILLEGYSENYMMLINNMASLFYSWEKPEQALEAFLKLEVYLEKYPDHRDLNYIQAVENTANYYAETGDVRKSENYYKRAIELRNSAFPTDVNELAGSMLLLASLYAEESRPDLATTTALEAYRLLRNVLAPGDPDLIWILSFLGQNFYNAEQYNTSLYYFQEAREHIELSEDSLSQEAPAVYNNLGALYFMQNMLREAIPCMEKAHELEPEDPVTLINLGLFYFELGNTPVARDLFKEAKEIYRKEYGSGHPEYARALIQVVTSKADLGDFSDEMLEEIREVEQICQDQGIDSTARLFIDCMRAYRVYYFGIRDYVRARSYGEQITGLVGKGSGRESGFYVQTLLEQAGIYAALGEEDRLNGLYDEALSLAPLVEDEDPENLIHLIESSRFSNYYHLQEYERSREIMERVIEKDKSRFLGLEGLLSPRERAGMSAGLVNLVEYNNFLMRFPGDPEVISNALNNRLFVKSILMDSELRQREALASTSDTLLIGMNSKYAAEKRLLANLRSQFGVEEAVLDSIETGILQTEREISRRLGEEMAMGDREIRWQDIRDALGEEEAAVEVVMFYYRTAPPGVTLHPWYLAFIITKDMEESPLCLTLFDAVEVVPEYESYRGSVESLSGGQLEASLYERLWSKIDSVVNGKRTILFSPDGLYHQINVEALPDHEGTWVIDKYEIRHLHSLAEILEEERDYSENRTAMLAGDPMFRMSLAQVPDPVPQEQSRTVSEFQSRMFPGTRLSPLPGTRTEVDSIGAMLESMGWECSSLTGNEASEDAVVRVRNPRVLHLATHGFFAENREQATDTIAEGDFRNFEFQDSESDARSCLFFAGAQNTLFYAYDYQPGSGDGILTAWEISEMELDSTELVVLSACETGLGDVLNSEGVTGLRRAFHLAGARRILLSLWEVDDQATQLLMRRFYANWLSGMELDQALSEAKRFLMRETEFSHPRYWAAFILSGI